MAHGISEQDWMRYLDGDLERVEWQRVDDHVAACQACASQASELRQWQGLLREEGTRLGEAIRSDERQVETLIERSLDRIRRARAAAAWTVTDGLSLLRFVMEPICGSGATRAAMNLAIQRSAGSEEDLTGTNWGLFVVNLGEATTLVCGLATGRLVSRAGSCLSIAG